MSREALLIFLADAILIVHALFVSFVVAGLLAIYFGLLLKWRWVRNSIFRVVHLLAIGIVVVQSWLGVSCPLTVWEMALRREAHSAVYSESFIAHWLQQLIYFSAPDWVFVVLYTGFGALVLTSWYLVPPGTGAKR